MNYIDYILLVIIYYSYFITIPIGLSIIYWYRYTAFLFIIDGIGMMLVSYFMVVEVNNASYAVDITESFWREHFFLISITNLVLIIVFLMVGIGLDHHNKNAKFSNNKQ